MNPALPFQLQFQEQNRNDAGYVQRFVSERGERVLKVLGEKPFRGEGVEDSPWQLHSHGACLQLESEGSKLFERWLIILPRPEQYSAKRFQPWAEGRLRHYGRYIDGNNSGRIVRLLSQKQVVIGVLMRRRGFDLQHPDAPLPPLTGIVPLLLRLSRELQRYILWMQDEELGFVQALSIHEIPDLHNPPKYLMSLDALPTVLGLRGSAVPLHPVTLLRGVIGELAEQLDRRGLPPLEPQRPPLLRLWDRFRRYQELRELQAHIRELDNLSARIDLTQPELGALEQWIRAFTTKPKKQDRGGLKALTLALLLCVFYLLTR